KAAHGSFSHGRVDAGLARLGGGLVRVTGSRGSQRLYIDGPNIGDEVLAVVPSEHRPKVAASHPPSSVPPDSECPGTVPRDAPSVPSSVSRTPPIGGCGTGRSLDEEKDTRSERPGSSEGGTVDHGGTVDPRPSPRNARRARRSNEKGST